jgi:hypothetical protein
MVDRLSPQGHPNADFMEALTHGVGHHAVDPYRREHQRQRREKPVRSSVARCARNVSASTSLIGRTAKTGRSGSMATTSRRTRGTIAAGSIGVRKVMEK